LSLFVTDHTAFRTAYPQLSDLNGGRLGW